MIVAYFSAEFGITECLSIFAGGLGVLAGDHLKASSDLGLPLVGVGLLYQQGYFRQYLNAAGWQQEAFEDNDFHTWPIELIPNVKVSIDLPDGKADAQVWHVNVGRIQLFCWTRICRPTGPNIAGLPRSFMAGIWKCVCGRKFSWGSADIEPWKRSA